MHAQEQLSLAHRSTTNLKGWFATAVLVLLGIICMGVPSVTWSEAFPPFLTALGTSLFSAGVVSAVLATIRAQRSVVAELSEHEAYVRSIRDDYGLVRVLRTLDSSFWRSFFDDVQSEAPISVVAAHPLAVLNIWRRTGVVEAFVKGRKKVAIRLFVFSEKSESIDKWAADVNSSRTGKPVVEVKKLDREPRYTAYYTSRRVLVVLKLNHPQTAEHPLAFEFDRGGASTELFLKEELLLLDKETVAPPADDSRSAHVPVQKSAPVPKAVPDANAPAQFVSPVAEADEDHPRPGPLKGYNPRRARN